MATEELLVRECLERAVAEFQSNPLSAELMRRFATDTPRVFAPVAVSMLLNATEAAGFKYLAMLLMKQPSLFKQLSDAVLSRAQAIIVTRRLMSTYPSLDIRFARQLPAPNGSTPDTLIGRAAERALDILDELSPGNRIVPILSHLTRHADQKISAKATLLIGKRVQNAEYAERILSEETDPRIRGSAIEAVWGNDSPPVQQLFWDCMEDRHNRVVGNAMVGLYLAGEEKVNGLVSRLAFDSKPEFRMTSAWVMGKIGNADFLPTLSPLMRDKVPGVRSAALRALQTIRQVEKMRRPSETDLVKELLSDAPVVQEPQVTVPKIEVELRLDGSHHAVDRTNGLGRHLGS